MTVANKSSRRSTLTAGAGMAAIAMTTTAMAKLTAVTPAKPGRAFFLLISSFSGMVNGIYAMTSSRRLLTLHMVIGVWIAFFLVMPGAQAADFIPLGDLPGGDFDSVANDVSDDGTVVVGIGTNSEGSEAFRWTSDTGMVGLGDFPGGFFRSRAWGVSADGSVVVGGGSLEGPTIEAFRWTSASGMVGLGAIHGTIIDSGANAVSADGKVVVGSSIAPGAPAGQGSNHSEAFRWTSGTGMVGLGDLAGGRFQSSAKNVSADGNVVVGYSQSSADVFEAFRWTEADGMIGLGDLPGGEFSSRANDVSADGNVVVGWSTGASGMEAYRWTNEDGMVGLGAFPGEEFRSEATGVSADGSIIVGESFTNGLPEGVVWTQANGMERLQDVLMSNGATGLSDWSLLIAMGISSNGQWVVGQGTNPSGNREAFLADISNDVNQGFAINAGHAGAWFNPDTSGQGQLIDVEPEEQFMFISWFTYTDAASANPLEQRWFTAQGNYSGDTAVLDLFETLGGKFDDPQEVFTAQVGEVILSFSDCEQGQMTYLFDEDELQGEFPLLRVIPGSGNVCEGLSGNNTEAVDINAGMDGAWFDPDTSGQGFFMDAHPDPEGGNFIFVSWFTYGEETASGQRWLTAQGSFEGSMAEIDVFETSGGSFDDPLPPSTTQVGTMSIDFTDCSNAQLSYSLPADPAEGDIAITRVIPGGQALCEELAGAE